jgi:uncharacterized surface protein with fasciclin (FAS1) repeats
MVKLTTSVLLLGSCSLAFSESLLSSLNKYPETTTFQNLLKSNENTLSQMLPTAKKAYTVFIPSNKAFQAYASKNSGAALTSLSPNDLSSLLRYHVAVGLLSSKNFTQQRGITVPTLLDGQQYNNRSAGNQFLSKYGPDARGQVLYISSTPINNVRSKFKIRQASSVAEMRSGLGLVTQMNAVDAQFDEGQFQIIDE